MLAPVNPTSRHPLLMLKKPDPSGPKAAYGLDGVAVKGLLQGAVLQGCDPLAILRDASIDPSVYGNAQAAIDGPSLTRLVRRIQSSIDDVYLGFLAHGCRMA